jgi:tetratricopeptide (TPR) repeat protein
VKQSALAVPLFLVVFLVGSITCAALLERTGARAAARGDWLFLPNAAQLKPMLLGYQGVAADLLWMQVVQYVGLHWQTDKKFVQLSKALDLATSLDPHFVEPYRFGALYLLYLSREPAAAVALLKKGAAANPTRWELPHDLGRYYYLEAQDYAQALEWWERAAGLPGRPDYLARFVARLHARTGHAETALELWLELERTAQSDYMRDLALREIERLRAAHGPQVRVE